MMKNKTLLGISYSTCPNVYVNKHILCLTYLRVTTKGRYNVRNRNLRITFPIGTHILTLKKPNAQIEKGAEQILHAVAKFHYNIK